jgi:DNA-binding MarR family transcriptional regulator
MPDMHVRAEKRSPDEPLAGAEVNGTAPLEACGGNVEGPLRVDADEDSRLTSFGVLVEAFSQLNRVFNTSLESSVGLPGSWFEVLLRLGRSPGGHLTMGNLAAQLAITSGGVTRLVDRVEGAGYVERQSCATDRRVQYVAITPSGLEILGRAVKVHLRDLDRHFTSRLEPGELETLCRTLDKLRRAPGHIR